MKSWILIVVAIVVSVVLLGGSASAYFYIPVSPGGSGMCCFIVGCRHGCASISPGLPPSYKIEQVGAYQCFITDNPDEIGVGCNAADPTTNCGILYQYGQPGCLPEYLWGSSNWAASNNCSGGEICGQ